MSVRLGYACISIPMREKDVYTGRTLTLESYRKKGVAAVKQLARQNVKDLLEILKYNEGNGYRFYRITSNLFPHLDNPKAPHQYTIGFARKLLREAGDYARANGHRITAHPGQFAQLGSPREGVVAQTFRDLTAHSQTFQYMGLTPEHGTVMIIHGGGTFGDKEQTLARWEENFSKLPRSVSQYIALENDEWQYSVLDLLPLCERTGIPLCIDFFHHEIGHSKQFDIFDPALLRRVIATWHSRGIKPKCHWSNQAPGKRKGTHGDCVHDIPASIMDFCITNDVDIMIEAKLKDVCLAKILKKQFTRVVVSGRVTWRPR